MSMEKKKETKLQELERRIAALESRPYFVPPQITNPIVPQGKYCEKCGQWKCAVCGKFYYYSAQVQQVPGMPFSTC